MESAFAQTYDFVTKYMLIASHWMLIPTIIVMVFVIVLGVMWFARTILPIFIFIGSLVSTMFLEYIRLDPTVFEYSPVFHSLCILLLLISGCYLGSYFIYLRLKFGYGKSIFIPLDAVGPIGPVGKEGPVGRQGQPGREGKPGTLSSDQEILLFDAHKVLEKADDTADVKSEIVIDPYPEDVEIKVKP